MEHIQLIAHSVNAGYNVLKAVLQLSPVHKESIRYVADFGFVQLSYCCLSILQTYQKLGNFLGQQIDVSAGMLLIEKAAKFLEVIAIDSNHGPAAYGSYIARRLEVQRSTIIATEGGATNQTDNCNLVKSGVLANESDNIEENMLYWEAQLEDPLWDFPVTYM